MTKTTMRLELACNGRTLALGPGEAADITKVTGLESSELEVSLTDLAVVDGASVDGRHVKPRPIHIEGSFRSLSDPASNREELVRFFNPKHPGTLTATLGDRVRAIGYELEGWSLDERRNLDARVGFVADLICPDPYFYGPEQNPDFNDYIENGGDVETGWTATFYGPATSASVTSRFTGEYMRVTGIDLKEGDELVISTEDRAQTITINGESAFRYIDRTSTPFKLPLGMSRISLDGAYVRDFGFRPRYFGI